MPSLRFFPRGRFTTLGSSWRLRRSVLDENLGWKPTLSSCDELAMKVWQLIQFRAIHLERRRDWPAAVN
jgi:hypothetical protein